MYSIFSITLILVADKELYSQRQIDDLLETAYDSMVILFGLDDLSSIKNVERFKRDIRVSIKTSRIIVLLAVSQLQLAFVYIRHFDSIVRIYKIYLPPLPELAVLNILVTPNCVVGMLAVNNIFANIALKKERQL